MLRLFTVCALSLLACGSAPAQEASKPAEKSAAESKMPPDAAKQVNPVKPTPASQAQAKKTYGYDCAMCHGKDASGDTPVAKALKVSIPPLASKEVQALSDAEIQKAITDGKGKMKPVKDLSKGDLADLVAFIRSLAKK